MTDIARGRLNIGAAAVRTDSRGRAAASPAVRSSAAPIGAVRHSALIVDLNNFATFPTLAVGILIASLRNTGHEVRLLSPLAYDVPASERERAERWYDQLQRRIHLSDMRLARVPRDAIRSVRYWWLRRPHPTVLKEVSKALEQKPDVLMLSAYLQHYATVREIGKLAQAAGVPMLLGGPAFNLPETANAWRDIPGLTAIYGGEADLLVPELVQATVAGEDLLRFDGVVLPGARAGRRRPFASSIRRRCPTSPIFLGTVTAFASSR